MTQTAGATTSEAASVKETVVSIIIAFVVAFVFRGFVLEPFLIPTGSMAPTLLGAHMRFRGTESGYTWTVGPWTYGPGQIPTPIQRDGNGPVRVADPMTGSVITEENAKIRSGDRIFVMKSLYTFFDPERFDVVVFKNPTNPQETYIKRLIGLPNEQLAFVDGDVFTRTPPVQTEPNAWEGQGWKIARKGERIQRAVWQPVFSSEYTPMTSLQGGSLSFRSPWLGGDGWDIAGKSVYRFSGAGATELRWDARNHPIDDFTPYNELPRSGQNQVRRYPVSDVRVQLAIKPSSESAGAGLVLNSRRHEFRAEITGQKVTIRMKPALGGDWKSLASATLVEPLRTDRFTEIEFWHADQSLRVFVAGKEVCSGVYDWSPEDRVQAVFGRSTREMMGPGGSINFAFVDAQKYQTPELRLEFTGGPLDIQRVALDRDLHYQACIKDTGSPGTCTDPRSTPSLGPDHFFVCGDNSASSLDARLWTRVDPWVAEQIDPTPNVVHRDLLVGKAFFVYFPAPETKRRTWMPDLGRLRFIW